MTTCNPVVASTVVGIQGPAGGGSLGSKEYSGSGVPSTGLGNNGDHYINTTTGDYYEKQSGAWVVLLNITGPAGATGAAGSVLRNGAVAPSNSTGVDGDYYLNTVSGYLSLHASGTYLVVANLKGPAGASGSAGAAGSVLRNGAPVPSNSLGVNGDYFLNTTTGDVSQLVSGAYTIVANFKGPQGAAGDCHVNCWSLGAT